jgi:hypothetical protein
MTQSTASANLGRNRLVFPIVGSELTLARPWRFVCDYIPLNYTFLRNIGFPVSFPILKRIDSTDKIKYSFDQDVPNTKIARQLDFAYVITDPRIEQTKDKPPRVYDRFHCILTLPVDIKMTIISANMKTGGIRFRIDTCQFSELEGQTLSVILSEASFIEFKD